MAEPAMQKSAFALPSAPAAGRAIRAPGPRSSRVLIGGRSCLICRACDYFDPASDIIGFLRVADTAYVVVPDLSDPVEALPAQAAAPAAVAEMLTARELQIAELIASGRCNKDVARMLGLSVWTVATHLRSAFSKLGVRSRTELAARIFDRPPRLSELM